MGRGAVAAAAKEAHGDDVGAREHDAGAERKRARGQIIGQHMHPEGCVDSAAGDVQNPLVEHQLGSAPGFFAWLKHEHHVTAQLIAPGR
jgi:hypothetical protein